VGVNMSYGNQNSIKPYNFTSTVVSFGQEYLNGMESVFTEYARLLATSLSLEFRSTVHAKVLDYEVCTFEEFVNDKMRDKILVVYKMKPFDGNTFLTIDAQCGASIVEHLCGGSEVADNDNVSTSLGRKRISTIDEQLLKKFFQKNLSQVVQSYMNIGSTNKIVCDVGKIDINPIIYQTVDPNDPMLIYRMEVDMLNKSYVFEFNMPYDTFGVKYEVLKKERSKLQERVNTPKERYNVTKQILGSEVNLSVIVGRTQLLMKDLMEMKRGDIVMLDQNASLPIVVEIENEQKFLAQSGVVDRKYAAQIIAKIESED
jgi:flagellar motor switch protein FliM